MAIEIYSKTNCPHCDNAKSYLRMHGKDYVEYKLDEDFTREVLVTRFPEAKTFPVIVVDGMHIGGFDQMIKYITENTDNRKYLAENYHGA